MTARTGLTEADVIDLLRRRYGRRYTGNGSNPKYVHGAHIRAQLWEAQSADFIAMDCSEYRNNVIHGHEIKCSRSDWLRELKRPDKAEAFRPYCDYWWLVTSDHTVVRSLDELPAGWGLLYAQGRRLIVRREADRNPDVAPMPRGVVASFIRRASVQMPRPGDRL